MTRWTRTTFGHTAAGDPVDCWTGEAGRYAVELLTYGGTLRSFRVPAPEGRRDILLGFDSVGDYEAQDKYMGATVGRVANRIAGASFPLDGRIYPLAANNGPNCLHGGTSGFDRKLWTAVPAGEALTLARRSPDGEEGFPGMLEVRVTFSLTETGALSIDYRAESDQDTLCSLTTHGYFNLLGHGAGSLTGQNVQILADWIGTIGPESTPTGRLLPVEGTPFDLRTPTAFLDGLAQAHPQMTLGNGYDHNFILHGQTVGPLRRAAVVTGGGLKLVCETTQPGLQLYTANFLSGERGKDGVVYGPRSAFCLEAQGWPDAIHHPDQPSPILRAGETYHQRTIYTVTAE